MRSKFEKLYAKFGREAIAYVVAGTLTTAVNYALFTLFTSVFRVDIEISDIIAISVSILFAFFANKYFVFRSKCNTKFEAVLEFTKFIASRVVSMLVEHYGLLFFIRVFSQRSSVAKIEAMVFAIILNYFLSKLLVFNKKNKGV